MSRFFFLWLSLCVSALGERSDEVLLQDFHSGSVSKILLNYCYDCHGDGIKEGDIILDEFTDLANMRQHRRLWKSVRNQVKQHIMPPRDEDQPTVAERKAIIQWIDNAIFPVNPDNPNPGKVTLRRLNITEYRHTIYDLLGVHIRPDQILPPDDSGYGFDSIGDVLTLSPSHLVKFHALARTALQKAYKDTRTTVRKHSINARHFQGGKRDKTNRILLNHCTLTKQLKLEPGTYDFEIRASQHAAGDEPAQMKVSLDSQELGIVNVSHLSNNPGSYILKAKVLKNGSTLKISFLNDYFKSGKEDRNLVLHSFTAYGPTEKGPPPLPKTHLRLFPDQHLKESNTDYTKRILKRFARKAFRRPVMDSEVERYASIVELAHPDSPNLIAAIRPALEAILISPHFLFRGVELIDSKGGKENTLIPETTLASRLSYFLWSSQPDEQLLALAEKGQLRAKLDSQIDRMLKDKRTADRLTDSFFHQWLQTRNIDLIHPNPRKFRNYRTEKLSFHFKRETTSFYKYLIFADRPMTDLVNADYTFADKILAKYYNFPNLEEFEDHVTRYTKLPKESHRRGILTHGSVLAITSNTTRTSPVKRGKWVLENLLDTPPPPAPANVPSLSESQHSPDTSVRDILIEHRKNPSCASCHEIMDGIGFSFEKFDAIGKYRDTLKNKPINTNGDFASGETFDGTFQLSQAIMDHKIEDFKRCVAVKMLTFALGRGMDFYDEPALEIIVSEAEKEGLCFSAYVKAVVNSVPFQYYRP